MNANYRVFFFFDSERNDYYSGMTFSIFDGYAPNLKPINMCT